MSEAYLKDLETFASHRVPEKVLILAVPAEDTIYALIFDTLTGVWDLPYPQQRHKVLRVFCHWVQAVGDLLQRLDRTRHVRRAQVEFVIRVNDVG